MKKIVNLFVAAFAVLALSVGFTSCSKDAMGEMKILGTWKIEKMVVAMTLEGVEISETITLDKGDDDMFKTLTFTSDGKVVATYKNGETDTAFWEYSGGKLILTTEDSGSVNLEFHVEELTKKVLVITISESGAKLSYYFKR